MLLKLSRMKALAWLTLYAEFRMSLCQRCFFLFTNTSKHNLYLLTNPMRIKILAYCYCLAQRLEVMIAATIA